MLLMEYGRKRLVSSGTWTELDSETHQTERGLYPPHNRHACIDSVVTYNHEGPVWAVSIQQQLSQAFKAGWVLF